jgi:hypothetical protein
MAQPEVRHGRRGVADHVLLYQLSILFAWVRSRFPHSAAAAAAADVFCSILFVSSNCANPWSAVLGGRYTMRGSKAFYDAAWACNVAVIFAGVGAVIRNADLIGTGAAISPSSPAFWLPQAHAEHLGIMISVAVHLLWCVDVIGWLLVGKFYVGSAQFLVWPQTTWITIATTLHHVWFLPLVLFLLRGNGGLRPRTYWYAWAMYYAMMSVGRMMPYKVKLDDGSMFMLNINQGHKAYESVKIDWLHQFNDSHPLLYFTWAIILGCGIVTTPLYFALRALSRRWLEIDFEKAKKGGKAQ